MLFTSMGSRLSFQLSHKLWFLKAYCVIFRSSHRDGLVHIYCMQYDGAAKTTHSRVNVLTSKTNYGGTEYGQVEEARDGWEGMIDMIQKWTNACSTCFAEQECHTCKIFNARLDNYEASVERIR